MSQQVVTEGDTQAVAAAFLTSLRAADQWPAVVYLTGDLGAGKSVFARAMLQALGVAGVIKSPTYTLVEQYSVPLLNHKSDNFRFEKEVSHEPSGEEFQAAHLDLYRLADPEELYYIGFDDIVQTCDLILIEWPEKGFGQLPKATHDVIIEYQTDARNIQITEHS